MEEVKKKEPKPEKEWTLEEKQALEKPYPHKPFPFRMDLEAGKTYKYCACGLTKTEPWCDNSHKGTKFKPIKFTAKTTSTALICGCRRNYPDNGPYCDGSHSGMDW